MMKTIQTTFQTTFLTVISNKIINTTFKINLSRIAVRAAGFARLFSNITSRIGGSSFLSTDSVRDVALGFKSTLRNGDPGAASWATALPEFERFNKCGGNRLSLADVPGSEMRFLDEFISDNLMDEFAIDTLSDKRPDGVVHRYVSCSLLHGSVICAYLSWRAEGSARILSAQCLSKAFLSRSKETVSQVIIDFSSSLTHFVSSWGLHYRPQFL